MIDYSQPAIVCLSGWAQKYNCLEEIFFDSPLKKKYQIFSLDYCEEKSLENFFAKLSRINRNSIVIGWSLGGQLLTRAIANKIINPTHLILIAPPFQMLKDSRLGCGMTKQLYAKVQQALSQNSSDMLKEFLILMAMNDKNSREIINNLRVDHNNLDRLKFWYEELCAFSCFDLDFSDMPPTLYFHGLGDMVVHISQKNYFQNNIKNFKSVIFEKCGHAPHISFKKEMREQIENFILT